MPRKYSIEQVTALLEDAVAKTEQSIFAGLYGADNESRLDSLDQLDALQGIYKQMRIILEREETSQGE